MRVVRKQLLTQVLRGAADANIRFDDLRSLLTALGFVDRVKGSHHNLYQTRRRGNPQSSTTRLAGKAVPGQASSGCDSSV